MAEGSDNFLEKACSVIVDHEGQIIADPDIGEKYAAWKDNQNQKVRRFHTTANGQEKACPLPYL